MSSTTHRIIPRDIRFGIAEEVEPDWLGGDLLKSAFIDGFAVLLPDGERFFIRSLKHFTEALDDPEVRAGIQGYAVQEALHTREHESYNEGMRRLGHDVEAMTGGARDLLDRVTDPVLRLFVTCAIEHITYSLSRFHLTRMEFLDQCSPAYRRLWLWHALEEIEHSAVAMQVLRAATPRMRPWKRYLARISVFNAVVSAMFSISLRNTAAIVRRQHPGAGPRTWLRLGWVLLGPPGLLRGMLPLLAAYYRPGFAGTAPSDALLVEKARGSLLAAMPAAVPA